MRRNKVKVFRYFFLEVDILHIILLEDQVSLYLQEMTQKPSVDTAHVSTHYIRGQTFAACVFRTREASAAHLNSYSGSST